VPGELPVVDGDGAVGGAPPEPDEEERAADAARAALARARAAAAARGLRPGGPVRPRRRRVAGEPRASGAAPDDRDPQELAAGLERLVSERGWGLDLAVGGVLGRWPQVVGPQLAAHCRPESFDDGLLVVRADSTAWATQVRLLVPTVLRRLAEELGDGVVEQLRVQGPSAPSWRRGSRAVRGRGPRDTYG
jgi:predicted nucleic acid-binding Zn ribbon protein